MLDELHLGHRVLLDDTKSLAESVPSLNQEQKEEILRMLVPSFGLEVPEKVQGSPYVLGMNNTGLVVRKILLEEEPLVHETKLMKTLTEHHHWKELEKVAVHMWNQIAQANDGGEVDVLEERLELLPTMEQDICPHLYQSHTFQLFGDGLAMKNKTESGLVSELEIPEVTWCMSASLGHNQGCHCITHWGIPTGSDSSPFALPSAYQTDLSKSFQVDYLELIESPHWVEVSDAQIGRPNLKQGLPNLECESCRHLPCLKGLPDLLENKIFVTTAQLSGEGHGTIHNILSLGQELHKGTPKHGLLTNSPTGDRCLLEIDRTMDETMMIDPNEGVLLFPVPRLPDVACRSNVAGSLVQDSNLRQHITQSYALYLDWSLLDPNFPLEAATMAIYHELLSPQLYPRSELKAIDQISVLRKLIPARSPRCIAAHSPTRAVEEDFRQSKQSTLEGSTPNIEKSMKAQPAALDELQFFKMLKDKEQPGQEVHPPEDQNTKKEGLHTVTDVFSILPEAHRAILQQLLEESAGLALTLPQPVQINTDIQSVCPQELKRLESLIKKLQTVEIQPSNETRQNEFYRLILVYVLYQAAACLLHYGIRAAQVYVSYNLKMIPPLSRFLEGKSVERLSDALERVEHGELQDCSKLALLSMQLKRIFELCPEPKVLLLIDNRAAFSVVDTIAGAKFRPFILDKAEILLSQDQKPKEEEINNAVMQALNESNCIISTYSHLHRLFPYQTFDCIIQYVECPLGCSSPEVHKGLEHAATDRIIFHTKVNAQDTTGPNRETVPDSPSKAASAKEPPKLHGWSSTLVVNASENVELKRNKTAWQTVLLAERGPLKVVERKMTLVVDAAVTPGVCIVFKEAAALLKTSGSADEGLFQLVTDVLLVVSFSFDACLFFLDTRGVDSLKWTLIAGMIHLAAESTQVRVQLFLCHNDSDVKRALARTLSATQFRSNNSLVLDDEESPAESFLNSCPSVNPLAAGAMLQQFGSVGEMLQHDWHHLATFCTSCGIPKRSIKTMLQQLQSHIGIKQNEKQSVRVETKRTYTTRCKANVEVGRKIMDGETEFSEAGTVKGAKRIDALAAQHTCPSVYIQRKRLQAPCMGSGPIDAFQPPEPCLYLSDGQRLEGDGGLSQSTSTSTDPDDPALFEMPLQPMFAEPRAPGKPRSKPIPGHLGSDCTPPCALPAWMPGVQHLTPTLGQQSWRDGQLLRTAAVGGPSKVRPILSSNSSFGPKTAKEIGKKRSAGPRIKNAFQVLAPKDVPRKRKAPRRSVGLSMKPLASASLGQVSSGRANSSSLQDFAFVSTKDNPSLLRDGEGKQLAKDGSLRASTHLASSSVQMDYTPPDKVAKRTLSFRPQKGSGGQSKLFWR